MKFRVVLMAAAFGLAACGGSTETVVTVQVVDFEGSTLGGIPVTAERRSLPKAGTPSEVLDTITTKTDGVGVAYLSIDPDGDYLVNASLNLPNEPGCAYEASGWVSVASPKSRLQLEKKFCR